ncbi:MAG: glycosyltransferase family 4 protein [Gemmatimonadaceae bacterium]
MKIALVTMRTDPARGGAERYTIDLAAALANEGGGHEVSMLASSFVGIPAGVKQVPIDASGLTRRTRYERFLDALDSHLAAARYDIVHAMLPVRRCDVYHPHAGMARANVATDSPLTKLLNPRRARVAAIEGRLLESANPPVVLCLSEYVKRAVEQWYALDETRLPILFNAVDLDTFDPSARPGTAEGTRSRFGIGDRECAALFIGQDFERKGLREAVLATARVRDSEREVDQRLKLLVAGKARATKYLALARTRGARDRVMNAGHTDDAYAMYQAADFLVLPTKHDPCSLVVLEGLAMGVPVISTRFNGACEIMANGVHGFVLDDPADVDALTDAMRRMLDPELRSRMSHACLELRPKLAYENHLRTLLGIYGRVVEMRA